MPKLKKSIETRRLSSHKRTSKSDSAADFVEPVRELLMLRISREIERREWTQAQAARFLGVTQPRVSDLVRGLKEKFTIDALVHWLGLLGMQLKIDTKSGGKLQSIYAWLDASDEAIPYYTKVIASQPIHTETYWKRANAYYQRGQFDLAIGDYTRAMELDDKLQHLRVNRAQSYICLGHFGAALLDCDRLIEQKPDAPTSCWAFITRASAQQALGRQDEAIKDLSKALKIEPNNLQAKKLLDDIRKKSGE